ncbi:MAG: CaiB/BaiF CoA-transferase family protein [Sulfitobacter sp.]
MTGPLTSLTVVEFAGLGPVPLAGQLLGDLGACVTIIDRVSGIPDPTDINRRNKRSIALDLKSTDGHQIATNLINATDILIEGFRPGVMERLNLGPADCPDHLIYGRMTGWGQTGPDAQTAGHDINYLAVTGALHAMGPSDRPPCPPLNLVADYGGGAMFLVFGVLSAVIERAVSGKGQVIDAAMIDGVPAMMGLIHTMLAKGQWSISRDANWLDGAAPFYRCYTCSDGKFIALGALEPQFFAAFLKIAELPMSDADSQNDPATWAEKATRYTALFKTRTRDAWAELFAGSDACVSPVLDFSEAALHPHNAARAVFAAPNGILQANPAPRFDRSSGAVSPPKAAGADSHQILTELGYSDARILALRKAAVLT